MNENRFLPAVPGFLTRAPQHGKRKTAARWPTALAVLMAGAADPLMAGTITVSHTGASSASTCTLAQAIYAANRANNPGNTTPSGATTLSPLSNSATTGIGVGTCSGATAGANIIQLPVAATIGYGSDSPDNFWYGPNALPPIASNITIEGRGATLTVTLGNSPRLRFFYIGADPQSTATPGYNTPGPGSLTLKDLTLSGGRQQGGASERGGAGAGLGGAIYNQGTLSLQGVTLENNQAVGGASALFTISSNDGGGLGADANSRSGMGGAVPAGTSDAGLDANATTGEGGAGGGTANGTGGYGGNQSTLVSSGGNGSGAGGSKLPTSVADVGAGGSGFGGGLGGASYADGNIFPNGGGSFGVGGDAKGSGGGVGGGGGRSSGYGGGGGFGAGGGNSGNGGVGGRGGFGGGGACPSAAPGYGGGKGHPNLACWGGGAGAGMGGAIFNHAGTLSIVNSTFSGNAANGGASLEGQVAGGGGSGFGGAIFNLNGSVHIAFSTLSGNRVAGGIGGVLAGLGNGAAYGGAVFSLAYNGAAVTGSSTASLTLEHSILANSIGGADLAVDQPAEVSGGLVNAAIVQTNAIGMNVVMSTIVGGTTPLPTFINSDPMLGALANNGGPTRTMALLPGSPAIDAATAGTPPATDQRDLARPFGAAADIGAFELGPATELILKDGFE